MRSGLRRYANYVPSFKGDIHTVLLRKSCPVQQPGCVRFLLVLSEGVVLTSCGLCRLSWTQTENKTCTNRYKVVVILSSSELLHRIVSLDRWCDLELLFGKFSPQLARLPRLSNFSTIAEPNSAGILDARAKQFAIQLYKNHHVPSEQRG